MKALKLALDQSVDFGWMCVRDKAAFLRHPHVLSSLVELLLPSRAAAVGGARADADDADPSPYADAPPRLPASVTAARFVGELADDCERAQDAISNAGAVPPLVAMLADPSESVQFAAAVALQGLTTQSRPGPIALIRSAGGVPRLVGLLLDAEATPFDRAACTLGNMAVEPEAAACAMQSGAARALLRTLGSPLSDEMASTMWALQNLATSCTAEMLDDGAVPALLACVLRHTGEHAVRAHVEVRDAAVLVLSTLACT